MIHIMVVMIQNKIIKVKKDEKTQEHFFDLQDFSDIFDISKVEYYEMEKIGENIVLKFLDKDKNILKPLKDSSNI